MILKREGLSNCPCKSHEAFLVQILVTLQTSLLFACVSLILGFGFCSFFFVGPACKRSWLLPYQGLDRILHHVETIGNHCLLEFAGKSKHFPGLFRWCEMDFVHPPYQGLDSKPLTTPGFFIVHCPSARHLGAKCSALPAAAGGS